MANPAVETHIRHINELKIQSLPELKLRHPIGEITVEVMRAADIEDPLQSVETLRAIATELDGVQGALFTKPMAALTRAMAEERQNPDRTIPTSEELDEATTELLHPSSSEAWAIALDTTCRGFAAIHLYDPAAVSRRQEDQNRFTAEYGKFAVKSSDALSYEEDPDLSHGANIKSYLHHMGMQLSAVLSGFDVMRGSYQHYQNNPAGQES